MALIYQRYLQEARGFCSRNYELHPVLALNGEGWGEVLELISNSVIILLTNVIRFVT